MDRFFSSKFDRGVPVPKAPPIAVEMRPIDRLIPYARNARTHSDQQIAQLAASIREFGWTNPILVDGENGIIAGHGRVLAARKLGLDAVPVIELAHFSETQRRAYILADNKTALNAGWDVELLRLEITDLDEAKFDLSLIGFDLEELGDLIEGPQFAPASAAEQGRLDEKKRAKCPECGHEFVPE